jgi:hypothetical protein
MPKLIATPKQEGGGGFTFEDKVSASFLVKCLSGEPPLHDAAGIIESVRFQKRVDGWFLNDVVLRLEGLEGFKSEIAISIKSNAQLTENGFPAEFTQAVWEQRLHVDTKSFDLSRDYLVLATATVNNAIGTAWHGLLAKAIDADAAEFARRIATFKYSNESERLLFQSLHCPKSVDNYKTPTDTAHLLKRLRHFSYDFENVPSADENTQIIKCRDLLRSGDLTEGASLWTHLRQLTRRFATSGGDLTRQQLADHLRTSFSLREFPKFEADWRRIAEDFDCQVALVKDKLGSSLSLVRMELGESESDSAVTALVGASGSGKTVLAKETAGRSSDNSQRVWLTATVLNDARPNTIFADLGLTHSFTELLSQTQIKRGVIVTDGLERLNQVGVANLAALLRYSRAGVETSPWCFIFTCVVDQWESVLRAFQKEFGSPLDIDVKPIEFQFKKQRATVIKAFPNLTKLFQRPELDTVFGNLKVLDLIVSNASVATNSESWIGETDVIDWFWEQVILASENGAACSRFVQKVSCVEADRFITEFPLIDFESDECRLAPELENSGVVLTRKERFVFAHDLLGDWGRSRYLLSHEHQIGSVIREKARNPRWQRAIRLFGLRLLEERSYGVEHWARLVRDLSPDNYHTIESDLVLESVVFAAKSLERLEQIWSTLLQDNGVLLNRLLTRFLHVATLPDPRFIDASASVRALYRYPFWPLWMSLLQVLFKHRSEAIPLAINQVTQIAQLWLDYSDEEWPLRKEVARILLDATDYIIKRLRSKSFYSDTVHAENVLTRLLTAAPVLIDEVQDRVLGLVERQNTSLLESPEDNEIKPDQGIDVDADLGLSLRRRAEPWPEGPHRCVNHHVEDAFLDSSNPLRHLFKVRPDAAKEALLALLIKEPLPINPYDDGLGGYGLAESLGIEAERDWQPAMFFHGPFLAFLQINPEKGIETIVTLLNFATQRWIDTRSEPEKSISIHIDGEERRYSGSNEAYFWYRDSPHVAGVLPSALMALEKWLYDCLEEERPIDEAVRQILWTSKSTALLGVLVAVGRRYPKLFKCELRNLVPLWELQAWEEIYLIKRTEALLGMTMGQWTRWGEQIWSLTRDWHTLPHRKTTLSDVLLEQFLTDKEMREYINEVHADWQRQLSQAGGAGDATYLQKFVLKFDEKNWKARNTEQGIIFDFVEPEDIKQRLAPIREANALEMEILNFPFVCRQIIDDKKVLSEQELAHFWTRLNAISNRAAKDDEEAMKVSSSVIGGIAVLLLRHSEWLATDPERDKWCGTKLREIIDNPPPPPQFHIAESISNYHWDNFAAIIFPQLLADNPTATGIRGHCADFALAYNYSVVCDLMMSAFERRAVLKQDFDRLKHLVLLSTGLREVHIVTHGGNSVWGTPDIPFDLNAVYDDLIEKYVDGSLAPDLPSLSDIAESTNRRILSMVQQQDRLRFGEEWDEKVKRSLTKRIMRARGFDGGLLRSSFSWLSEIDREDNAAEREKWIACIEDFVKACLRPLGDVKRAIADEKGHSSFYSTPTTYETWIFKVVADVVPNLRPDEQARRLWEPILSFGIDRMYWVDSFLSAWFITGRHIDGNEPAFFREWSAMLEYAWSKENWWKSKVHAHFRKEELQLHLLGFSHGEFLLDNEKYLPDIDAIKPQFDRWIDRLLPNPEATSQYAHFLACPSSKNHLRDGIKRLSDAAPKFKEEHWSDSCHLDQNLIQLLEYDWNTNETEIKADDDIARQFTTLLKALSDRQIAGAFELQDRVARSR